VQIALPAATKDLTPFRSGTQAALTICRRLASTRWPEREPSATGRRASLSRRPQALVALRDKYDWRAELASTPSAIPDPDRRGWHSFHSRAAQQNAPPIILTTTADRL
jgi:hypothetical protein